MNYDPEVVEQTIGEFNIRTEGQPNAEGWLKAYCPLHDDQNPSFTINVTHGGWECRSGCGKGGDLAVLVVKMQERNGFFPENLRDIQERLRGTIQVAPLSDKEQLSRTYFYTDAEGQVIAEKGRFDARQGKSFRWRLAGVLDWPQDTGVKMSALPLYGVDKLKDRPDEDVYFVEGEKACEACWDQGLLAVTNAGGSGQKDFGPSLEVLKDRRVWLWPDNDAPGRKLMNMLESRLRLLASHISFVNVAVEEKGDAYDYFYTDRGTVDDMRATALTDPIHHILAEDSIEVAMPSNAGRITFTFTEMEKDADRTLNAEMKMTLGHGDSYTQRINMISGSARTELQRNFGSIYGKEINWARTLNDAFEIAAAAFLRQSRAIPVPNLPDAVSDFFVLDPLLVGDGATILFGDGSSMKSYLSLLMALCISMGEPFPRVDPKKEKPFNGMETPSLRIMYVDYEDSGSNIKRRLKRLAAGRFRDDNNRPILDDDLVGTGIYYWPANGIPLKDQVHAIRKQCEAEGINILIIDSAAPACGGSPENSVDALAFFRALKKIGLPSIIITHIPKAGDTQKPFGSVFWHNEARRTWFVSRDQDTNADTAWVTLKCRKVNDGQWPSHMEFQVNFDGEDGPVYVEVSQLPPDEDEDISVLDKVYAALVAPRTMAEIIAATGLDQKKVRHALNGDRAPFAKMGDSVNGADLWVRRERNPGIINQQENTSNDDGLQEN